MKKSSLCRRALLLLLCTLLVCMTAMGAAATSKTNLRIIRTQPETDALKIYTSLEGTDIDQSRFAVELGSNSVPVTGITTTGESKTLFYCLIDTSDMVANDQLNAQKNCLLSICSSLKNGDAILVRTANENSSSSGIMTDMKAAQEYISAMQKEKVLSRLYATIAESLEEAAQYMGHPYDMVCIVVLSKGDDANAASASPEYVRTKVQESNLPLYTVAVRVQNSSTNKNFASLAEASAGGRHFNPSLDQNADTVKETGKEIVLDMQKNIILTADISSMRSAAADRDVLTLRVQFTTKEDGNLEDSCDVYSADLLFSGVQRPEPELPRETEPSKESDEEAEEPTEEPKPNLGIIIGSTAAALILIAAAAVLLIMNKKKKEAASAAAAAAAEAEAAKAGSRQFEMMSDENVMLPEQSAPGVPPIESPTPPIQPPVPTPPQPSGIVLYFASVDADRLVLQVTLPENCWLTLGRDKRANLVLNPSDQGLSGVHCAIRLNGGCLEIADNHSRNGTFLNGVPIMQKGPVVVTDRDLIRMGNHEYRVIISKKL